jgi:hypothetical protein
MYSLKVNSPPSNNAPRCTWQSVCVTQVYVNSKTSPDAHNFVDLLTSIFKLLILTLFILTDFRSSKTGEKSRVTWCLDTFYVSLVRHIRKMNQHEALSAGLDEKELLVQARRQSPCK